MSLNLSGEPIEQVDKVKWLGIIIDNQVSWAEHIDTMEDGLWYLNGEEMSFLCPYKYCGTGG